MNRKLSRDLSPELGEVSKAEQLATKETQELLIAEQKARTRTVGLKSLLLVLLIFDGTGRDYKSISRDWH
jgi:hypothetical protein